jgi:hypothetical protein
MVISTSGPSSTAKFFEVHRRTTILLTRLQQYGDLPAGKLHPEIERSTGNIASRHIFKRKLRERQFSLPVAVVSC